MLTFVISNMKFFLNLKTEPTQKTTVFPRRIIYLKMEIY